MVAEDPATKDVLPVRFSADFCWRCAVSLLLLFRLYQLVVYFFVCFRGTFRYVLLLRFVSFIFAHLRFPFSYSIYKSAVFRPSLSLGTMERNEARKRTTPYKEYGSSTGRHGGAVTTPLFGENLASHQKYLTNETSPRHYTVDPMLFASGNPFKCHEEVLYLQPLIPPKRFDIFSPLTGGCSEGLGAF